MSYQIVGTNTYSEKEYLRQKFIDTGILNSDGSRKKDLIWDPYIYPDDGGYVPPCAICKNVYDTYSPTDENPILAPHCSCGCLWWDYFKEKILEINSSCEFSTKRNIKINNTKTHNTKTHKIKTIK